MQQDRERIKQHDSLNNGSILIFHLECNQETKDYTQKSDKIQHESQNWAAQATRHRAVTTPEIITKRENDKKKKKEHRDLNMILNSPGWNSTQQKIIPYNHS